MGERARVTADQIEIPVDEASPGQRPIVSPFAARLAALASAAVIGSGCGSAQMPGES